MAKIRIYATVEVLTRFFLISQFKNFPLKSFLKLNKKKTDCLKKCVRKYAKKLHLELPLLKAVEQKREALLDPMLTK